MEPLGSSTVCVRVCVCVCENLSVRASLIAGMGGGRLRWC